MQRSVKDNSNKRLRSQSPETDRETSSSQITSNVKRPKLDHRTGNEVDLSGMTYAAGAGRDTRKRCLPGTRTEILSQIMGWIKSDGDDVPRVLWLSGPAGTGKSAIAHTIASSFIDEGGLGSCYSFDRDRDADHRHEKVFSTIARDLADRHPEMRQALADAVQNDSALKTTLDVVQQWQKLLIEPLGKLAESTVDPIVIVIDALDESGAPKTRSHILHILANKLQDSAIPQITQLPKNIRIIITSRPLRDIDSAFAGAQHIRRMSMDDIPQTTAEGDIYAYVSKKLEGLPGFGSREFAALAKKADGLFEWARLACECIESPPPGSSPNESFDAVTSRDPADRENLLYDMYRFILAETMQKVKYPNATSQDKQLARFRSVMGQILGASEPLRLETLNAMRDHFPDKNEHYKVEVIVEHMGSLLGGTTNSSSPIRPLHTSFRDFLTDQSCSKEFFIDVVEAQRSLAFASLRVMEHSLRFNFCDIKSSYLSNSEVTGLRERIESIPPHLSYSSRFWAVHVQATAFDTELAKEVKSFFDHERLLFWIELLGLLDIFTGTVAALALIVQWLKSDSGFKDVCSSAMDVQRFIQLFGDIISFSTPHLYVSALPFSPVNSLISVKFAAKFPNTLRLASGHDMNWPTFQTVLRGHTGNVTSALFSPDGTRIASGSEDGVRLWDAATGLLVGEPLRHHLVTSVSFSPDGTRIVTSSWGKTVQLWDAATGQPVGEPLRGHTESVHSVSFSPDGTCIASGSWDRTVRLWDAVTGQPVGQPLRGHTGQVNSVSFSPDGTRIASGSDDKTARLWDAATGQPVGEPLWGHTSDVTSISFSPDGTRIATGSRDCTVRLWDATTGQPVGEPLRCHTRWVSSVSFSPDGTRIATGSTDKTVRLWDVTTGQPVGQPLRGHTDWVNSLSFSPDGTRIATGSRDKTVRLWAVKGQPVGEPLRGHTRSVRSVSFSPDGTRIATVSEDTTVRLWDAATGQPVGEPLWGHTDYIHSVSFSPDGTRIATGSSDNTVRLWDAATGQPVGEPLRGHTFSVKSVSFSPDGTRIATGSCDNTIRLWDAATGQPVGQPLRGHTYLVVSVSFSPDGTRIVTGSFDRTVRLWDAATGQPVGEPLRGHTSSVFSVSFSPDGTRIASGACDNTVRLWDAATGQPVGEPLRGHSESVLSVSFSPDGTRIVTGSEDNTVRLWDAATGQPVSEPLRGHTGSVYSVSFSPDGTRIASGSDDCTVRVWYAAVGQPHQEFADSEYGDSDYYGDSESEVGDLEYDSEYWNSEPAFPDEESTTSTNDFTRFSFNSIRLLLKSNWRIRDNSLAFSDQACVTNTKTTTTSTNDLIRSSSYSIPLLLNSIDFVYETSDTFASSWRATSFVGDDGWVIGPGRGQNLLWVPPAFREVAVCFNPRTALMIPRGCVELDLSRMAHGQHWQNCRADS